MICKASAPDAVELAWFKSSYSDGPDGNSCVEVAIATRTVHVRDSKHLAGAQLALAPEAWAGFLAYTVAR
ncbi:DUF397 domain-containing protein [Streptomyces olivaceus]|uniref:DUF397 domain-containing protein n=1 Tax=Streptomyces olivaceus TaxID=47716 RepID=A0ABS7W681_STROV|nr:DUF397 domain-containing protein [Streptomyces olivaceus]AOW87648.1 DUF397 domain-containing protein [Streptomyces olivaceus]MBZ6090964.1 DUF397 domain-containing protein [Streptomyces olivaceus]MBZ6097139.1 DUF397 domain-containing protein [Streptomyces olivaceus]MBZ6119324.1 DUF397 domain-containing protein [Streptomyces olivaceus]MBZ6153464.1 DUF397 domain-containing protein [Streptomyces olivaceus]